mmetsp:Transcript_45682/g.67424  ORF Transcript_45682/g.67424 Transcript_45682/m.67424 type:complete len:221 (-) Transcript_45682:129-791(-)
MASKSAGSALCANLFTIAAFCCTISANHMCNFLKITGTKNNQTKEIFRGIWKGMTNSNSECTRYQDTNMSFDTNWRSARAFSILTDVFGAIAVFTVLASMMPSARNKTVLSSNVSLGFMCCLFQGLTLLLLNSNACHDSQDLTVQNNDETCSIFVGANLSISAVVLWFCSSLAISCTMAATVMEASTEKEREEGTAGTDPKEVPAPVANEEEESKPKADV